MEVSILTSHFSHLTSQVVGERCVSDEAVPGGAVEFTQERMPV